MKAAHGFARHLLLIINLRPFTAIGGAFSTGAGKLTVQSPIRYLLTREFGRKQG
jgi:hypothetical protein